jgi:pimeloyl-ACP methyl ester carboxylesterase
MANAFADQGVATLRIDKRGVAGSVAAAQREEDLRFETYVEDTVSWMNFLRTQKRVSRIIVLGHSEGALIGSIAVQRAGAAGFISLSGAGYRASDVLRQQLGNQLTGELKQQAFSAIAELEAGRLVKNPPPALAALFRPSVQPYLISWFRYDPAVEIVQGTTDVQVSVDDARRLAGGKPDAVLKLLDGMNHVLRAAPAERAANLATYSNPALPLKPELMPTLRAFVGN